MNSVTIGGHALVIELIKMLVISHKEGRCAFETFSLQIDNGSQFVCFSLLSINYASELYHL